MKKYLFLFAACSGVQAQQAMLEQIEYLNAERGTKTVFTQHYDPHTQRIDVLSEADGALPYRHKRTAQYDENGDHYLYWEDFRWDEATQQWLKDARGEYNLADGKEVFIGYQGNNNEWIGYQKYETQTDEKSNTQITYAFSPEQQWIPATKDYTLYHSNKKPALQERYEWDAQHAQWRFGDKTEYRYDNNGQMIEQTAFNGKNGQWEAHLKMTYQHEPNGNGTYITWVWENSRWRRQTREILTWDADRRRKVLHGERWDAQTGGWSNEYRAESRFAQPEEQILSDVYAVWDTGSQQWQTSSESTYYYDGNGRVARQQNFYNLHREGWQTTYRYDDAGNVVEELVKKYNVAAKSWHDHEKTVYTYDLSLDKTAVLDKDGIADEELGPAVNALLQKDIYRIKDNAFTLAEQLRYTYNKPPVTICCKPTPPSNNAADTLVKRYFRSNSDLHKQKSDEPVYLYDEITENEALNTPQTAYYLGYYRGDTLVKYEKVLHGKILMSKEIEKTQSAGK